MEKEATAEAKSSSPESVPASPSGRHRQRLRQAISRGKEEEGGECKRATSASRRSHSPLSKKGGGGSDVELSGGEEGELLRVPTSTVIPAPEELYPGPALAATRAAYVSALDKLHDVGSRFVAERDGHYLKNFRGNHIPPDEFRDQLRRSINCRLSGDEMKAILPLLDKSNSGFCDGALFLILFYRIRHEIRSELLTERIAAEKRIKERADELVEQRVRDFESKNDIRLPDSFTPEEEVSAFEKLKYAAARYDRSMPGAVQPTAFMGRHITPSEFKEQLKSVFNCKVSLGELAALAKRFDPENEGVVRCSEFLVYFIRLGFDERARMAEDERRLKRQIEREHQAHLAALQKEKDDRNKSVVDFVYDKSIKERAHVKLREAVRLHNVDGGGAIDFDAFHTAFMEPFEFKEQMRRLLNLRLTPQELGALIDSFDLDGDRTINCAEFSKAFATMHTEERTKIMRAQVEKQNQEKARQKKAKEDRESAQAMRNAVVVSFDYAESDFETAMMKLSEAAWRYDGSNAGAVSLSAFRCKAMHPHEFKEQLKFVLNVTLSPKELGSLVNYFDTGGDRVVDCATFLVKFIRMGAEERDKRRNAYLEFQTSKEKERKMEEDEKARVLGKKNALKLESEFSKEDFDSAMSKLTTAAINYNKNSPGAVGLDAFEAEMMEPHIFKEQLKRAFNMKLTPPELGALMSFFDKSGTGVVRCHEFLIYFLKTGIDERARMRTRFRILKRQKEEADRQLEEERLAENIRRAEADVDFEFSEDDFDSALSKLLDMCHRFDVRQLGPAGFRAFQTDKLTPSEYREVLKRTFNLKVSAPELGALVTYFDAHFNRNVSCSAFLASFTQIRVALEAHKGKPDEAQFIADYHAQLKKAYSQRIMKQLLTDDTMVKKPWRSGMAPPNHRTRKWRKRPYPKTIDEKILRRLQVARVTARLDLASDATRPEVVFEGMLPIADSISEMSLGGVSEQIIDGIPPQVLVNQPLQSGAASDSLAVVRPDRSDDDASLDKVNLVFNLIRVPKEILKLRNLKELWLCNNSLGSLGIDITTASSVGVDSASSDAPPHALAPSEALALSEAGSGLGIIAELTHLTVLSLQGNGIQALPESYGSLVHLERVYLQRNKLTALPASFNNLKHINTLDLSNNGFAEVPEQVLSLQHLCYFGISHNPAILSLPEGLRRLSSLVYLDVSGIPFEAKPDVIQRMSWTFVLIDRVQSTATRKALGLMSSMMAYVPNAPDERDFKLYMSSRAHHSASKKGKRKGGIRK